MSKSNFQQVAAVSVSTPDSKYILGKMTLKHWAEYAQYIGFLEYHKAKSNDAPKEILDELFRKGLASDYSPTSPEVLESFDNAICFSKLLEISLKIGNPGISENEITEYLSNDDIYSRELVISFLERQGIVFQTKGADAKN